MRFLNSSVLSSKFLHHNLLWVFPLETVLLKTCALDHLVFRMQKCQTTRESCGCPNFLAGRVSWEFGEGVGSARGVAAIVVCCRNSSCDAVARAIVKELLHSLCCFECNSLFAIGCVRECSKHFSSVVAAAKYCSSASSKPTRICTALFE